MDMNKTSLHLFGHYVKRFESVACVPFGQTSAAVRDRSPIFFCDLSGATPTIV